MFKVLRSNLLRKDTFHHYVQIKRNQNMPSDDCCKEKRPEASKQDKKALKTARAFTLYAALPIVLIMTGIQWAIHQGTVSECEQRPEFVKYPYLRIRTKRFPWGDGNKTLFHNPHVNALPDGYEDMLEKNEEQSED